jgi:hypothetical protein
LDLILACFLRHVQRGIVEAEEELSELVPALEAKRNEEGIVRQELNKLEQLVRNVRRKLAEVNTNLLTHSKTTIKTPDIASFVSFNSHFSFLRTFL